MPNFLGSWARQALQHCYKRITLPQGCSSSLTCLPHFDCHNPAECRQSCRALKDFVSSTHPFIIHCQTLVRWYHTSGTGRARTQDMKETLGRKGPSAVMLCCQEHNVRDHEQESTLWSPATAPRHLLPEHVNGNYSKSRSALLKRSYHDSRRKMGWMWENAPKELLTNSAAEPKQKPASTFNAKVGANRGVFFTTCYIWNSCTVNNDTIWMQAQYRYTMTLFWSEQQKAVPSSVMLR